MTYRIEQFLIPIDKPEFELELSAQAAVIAAAIEDGIPFLYVEIPVANPDPYDFGVRKFKLIPTNDIVEESWTYIATIFGRSQAYHIYEVC